MGKYIAPYFEADAYTCMVCEVLAPISWSQLAYSRSHSWYRTVFFLAQCTHCEETSLWIRTQVGVDDEGDQVSEGRLILPASVTAPLCHSAMPEECKQDFEEARSIASRSPRGAAALLRLCLQKLCVHLGGKGNNINADIAELVRNGLAPQVQQALDYVRVTGNHAVHPGEISLQDSPEHVTIMFEMINLIVEERIHRPKMIAERFQNLPAGALEAIQRRDAPKLLTNENGG